MKIEVMRQAETLKFAPEAPVGAPDVVEELLSANCWKSCWSEEYACWAADKLPDWRSCPNWPKSVEIGFCWPDDWPESPSLWLCRWWWPWAAPACGPACCKFCWTVAKSD